MKYIELNNETKKYVKGNEELINQCDFSFNSGRLFSFKIEGKNVQVQILLSNSKLMTFAMNNTEIVDFEVQKYDLLLGKEALIDSIEISISNGVVFSLVIAINGGKDFRFMCNGLELISVQEFEGEMLEIIEKKLIKNEI